jgi:hypothetical protein
MVNDTELERVLREGLERRAGEADAAVPVAERARAVVRRRHRAGLAVGLAAASVAAVVVIAALDSTPPPPIPPEDRPVPAGPENDKWRTEYWADVQVDVPADWAWGGSPRRSGRHLVTCTTVEPGRPYVGRPIAQTDVCFAEQARREAPSAPYVWLGSPVEPGAVDLGEGWTQETVRVGESTLTVATDDGTLRAQILGSIRTQALCPPRVAERPAGRFDVTREGPGVVVRASVCAYQRRGETLDLVFASELGASQVEATVNAVGEASPSTSRCTSTSEVVILSVDASDPYSGAPEKLRLHQDVIYDLTCAQVRLGSGDPLEITARTVAPWALGGISKTLIGPRAAWAYDYFIGIQG